MTERDKAIKATLTSQPQWIEEWQEYAAIDDGGTLHTAEDIRKLEDLLEEANLLIAQAKRRDVAWEQALEASKKVRESVEVLLAEMKENQ